MCCTFVDDEFSIVLIVHLRFLFLFLILSLFLKFLLFLFKARVLAVLDWELSTTGHPLADLAYATMFYFWPTSLKGLGQGTVFNFKDTIGMKLKSSYHEFCG